jgi:hypothetical protein
VHIGFLWERRKDAHYGDLEVDGRIILNIFSEKYEGI